MIVGTSNDVYLAVSQQTGVGPLLAAYLSLTVSGLTVSVRSLYVVNNADLDWTFSGALDRYLDAGTGSYYIHLWFVTTSLRSVFAFLSFNSAHTNLLGSVYQYSLIESYCIAMKSIDATSAWYLTYEKPGAIYEINIHKVTNLGTATITS